MVKQTISWYKAHRDVLEGDLIHLRRADGRDMDYWLLVNPNAEEKGALTIFNPLSSEIKKRILVPLYYTGLTEKVKVFDDDHYLNEVTLDRNYHIELMVNIPPGGNKTLFFK
jgi:hypothetical protein